MAIIYENKVKELGKDIMMMNGGDFIIIFGDSAPAELRDYCYSVDVNPINGEMLKPYLFKSVVNGKGKTTQEGKTEKLVKTMDVDTAEEIKEVMKEAGESYGLSEVGEQGYSIAAKTGTAERGDGTNNAWLVTFAPADDPQYIIVANRLKTTEIGKTLAPVVEDLYDTLFDHE